MASDSHTGPRWIKTGKPLLFVESRSGIYHIRKQFSPGAGFKPVQVVRSLGTKSLTEALRKFDVELGRLRIKIEQSRAATRKPAASSLKQDVNYWQAVLRTGTVASEASYDDEIERRLGPVVRQDINEMTGEAAPIYAPGREAKTVEFAKLVGGVASPVDFYLPDFIAYQPKSFRYVSRIRLSVRLLADFLRANNRSTDVRKIDRRAGSDFIGHLIRQGGSTKTAKSKRSALSSYWSWLVERGDAVENFWPSLTMPKSAGKSDLRPYTEAEMLALLGGTSEQPMADFIRVGALSGMRMSEIGRLTVDDCVGGWFIVKTGKTANAARRLPVHSGLAAIVAKRSASKSPTDFLFHDLPKSSRGRAEKMGQAFTKYRRNVGANDVREDGRSLVDFHSFRRWFITQAVWRSGRPEWLVERMSGHAGPKQSMTTGTYLGDTPEDLMIEVVESVRLPLVTADGLT